LITPLMLPALLVVYYRLAKKEEAEALTHFGDGDRRYQAISGMFWPRRRC
jgi:protein-S-isoprenylcysteine O-methyltransferase Ste14